jgi:O-antigen chain-terminating methyltransferase
VLESLQNHDKALAEHGRHLSANLQAVGHLETQAAQLRAEFALIQRQFSDLLEAGGERFSQLDTNRQLEKLSQQRMHVLDALYSNFEDQFRGTREDVKSRVSVYLPMVKAIDCGTPDAPLLDLGCGRGEWLEILKSENFSAQGIDLNTLLVERCREMQLDVVESDIFEYLPSVADAGIGAITAFHLVEHLMLGDLIRLIDECIRVLKPGGMLIFETPNPENVLVGSCNFYYDPTHRNPVPPKLLKFLVESRGFYRVEILPLHPYGDDAKIPEDKSPLASRFNDYFYGPQDYAVIGYKA